MTPRKRLDTRVLRRMAIPLALVLAASFLVFPGGVLAASGPGPGADPGKATSTSFKELAKTRPYYAPDVAARSNPLSGELDRVAQKSLPSELLPESLLPQRSDETLKQNAGTGLAGAGTGGWTELKRMYMPSSDPDVTYRLYPGDSNNNVIDINGRRHDIYARRVSTDVSQPPDPAGIARKDLARIYYSTYSEGSWSNPINLTPTAGFQDTAAVLFETDDAGYLHFVYSRWSWTRDSSFAPGTPDAYQHSDENLFYRYRAPDGTWSAPRALTSFTGMWGIPGAFFTLENGRIYGTWLETFDRETAPASFTTRLLFMEGIRGDWDSARTIRHWDYTMGLGVEMPFSSPGLGVSPVTGEVILAYGTLMYGAGPDQHKTWIHAMVRSPGGSWSGPTRLVTATPNVYWIPTIVRYDRDGTTSNLLAIKTTIFLNSAADPPQTNMYLITHKASGWKSPLNATRLTAGHAFDAIDLSVDTFDTWHFTVSSGTFEWDAAHSQWNDVGDQLRYTYRTGATVSAYQTILGYHDGRFIGNVNAVVDRDGKIRALFDTHLTSAYDGTDYKVFYSDNVEGPGFSTPKKLTADSGQKVDNASLTTDPRGGSLASWFEFKFGTGNRPLAGALYSRYLVGGSMSPLKNATLPSGSDDIVHVAPGGWYYYGLDWDDTGTQQCLFETAKYNTATHVYYGFRKYYNETRNGIWGTPQLVSDTAVSAYPYYPFTDANQRVHALFEYEGTGDKFTLYCAMQKKPTPPATTYFFAEGTTRPGFQQWLCLQNPGGDDASAAITYMLGTGENKVQEVGVPAHSRVTVDVNAFVGPGQDVSALVSADRLIVAERPMYFAYGDRQWPGGSDAVGSDDTGRVWYFAEGTTRSEFSEYLTLQNPSPYDATVTVTYMLGDGTTQKQDVSVPRRSRATVDVKASIGEGKDVSMQVESDNAAVVAERPMYFDYKNQGWTGGHNSMGSLSLDTNWYFAEGTTRGGFDTYLCVQNPNAHSGTATITYILGDGSTSVQHLDLPATSRQTVNVNERVGAEKDVSIALASSLPVLAERPMYFYYHGIAPGGHVAMGALEPKNSWYFAEGTTRPGFDEWISLENPGALDAKATLSYMLGDGSVVDQHVSMPAHTRVTVDVKAAVGEGKDVSTAVWSDLGIIAERPMYFVPTPSTPTIQPGGTDVLGL